MSEEFCLQSGQILDDYYIANADWCVSAYHSEENNFTIYTPLLSKKIFGYVFVLVLQVYQQD